jgi:hypothetical protein
MRRWLRAELRKRIFLSPIVLRGYCKMRTERLCRGREGKVDQWKPEASITRHGCRFSKYMVGTRLDSMLASLIDIINKHFPYCSQLYVMH